jgi:outer membrane lipoprotein-sorting protein
MKFLWIALALALGTINASAADLASTVRAQLSQPAVLRGAFEQSKQVAGFSKPLLSSGDFVVARERGVLWNTRTPFASQLKLTRKQIVATQNGQVSFQLSASQEPTVRVINSLMFSLLSGDVGALGQQFKISGSSGAQGWKLVLTPLQPGLSKVMSQITLSGDKYVRRIEIVEASGDITRIRFAAQQASQAPLGAEESAQFD